MAGVRIADMPNLGTPGETSTVIGEKPGSGSGSFTVPALRAALLQPAPSADGVNGVRVAPFDLNSPYIGDTAQVFSTYTTGPGAGSGTAGAVVANGRYQTNITGAPVANLWSLLGIIDHHGTGGTGQHVPVYGQGIRRTLAGGGAANNPEIWGGCFSYIDMTGQPSSLTNSGIGVEIDFSGNGLDDASNRACLVVAPSKFSPGGTDFVVTTGIGYSSGAGVTTKQLLNLAAPFTVAGIDLRTSVQLGGATIWLHDNADIALDSAATARLRWDTTVFSAAGGARLTSAFQIDGATTIIGNVALAGDLLMVKDAALKLTNQVNGAAAAAGTLLNAPGAGNPVYWVPISINGVARHFPVW